VTEARGPARYLPRPFVSGASSFFFIGAGSVLHYQAVLDCWFFLHHPGKKHDSLIRKRLGKAYGQAAGGEFDGWREQPRGRLALILLLDQVPRHIHRDRPESYATDAQARECTALFFARRDWQGFSPLELLYVAHPWLHAEDAGLQEQVNPFIHGIAPDIPGLEYMGGIADLYLETIRRFGRFPHRNGMLGRESTPEEERFLAEEWFQRRRGIRMAYSTCPARDLAKPAP
jgi:uncharacterized protein (DUF924 family)